MHMAFSEGIRGRLLAQLSDQRVDSGITLLSALRLLAKWRSALIQRTLISKEGTRVLGGPFKGLEFVEESSEGCHIAKLLGCYEQPLHPFIEVALKSQYYAVLNIGCAEGYYAVGFAIGMDSAKVYAFDTDEKSRTTCTELAERNSVSDRVSVSGHFEPSFFERYLEQKTLILCDIEGGESHLLDPSVAPALKSCDIVVESHEHMKPGITNLLCSRFAESHKITIVQDSGARQLSEAPAWFLELSHLDQLLAFWEWRSGPTPWVVMNSKLIS